MTAAVYRILGIPGEYPDRKTNHLSVETPVDETKTTVPTMASSSLRRPIDSPPPPRPCAHSPLDPLSRTDDIKKKGLFLAPTIVGESLKGAFLLAEVFGGTFGLPANPPSPLLPLSPPPPPPVDAAGAAPENSGPKGLAEDEGRAGGVGGRTDIVQALELGDRDKLIKFCEAVQLFSPVNAYVRPGEFVVCVRQPVSCGVRGNCCCPSAQGTAAERGNIDLTVYVQWIKNPRTSAPLKGCV